MQVRIVKRRHNVFIRSVDLLDARIFSETRYLSAAHGNVAAYESAVEHVRNERVFYYEIGFDATRRYVCKLFVHAFLRLFC